MGWTKNLEKSDHMPKKYVFQQGPASHQLSPIGLGRLLVKIKKQLKMIRTWQENDWCWPLSILTNLKLTQQNHTDTNDDTSRFP